MAIEDLQDWGTGESQSIERYLKGWKAKPNYNKYMHLKGWLCDPKDFGTVNDYQKCTVPAPCPVLCYIGEKFSLEKELETIRVEEEIDILEEDLERETRKLEKLEELRDRMYSLLDDIIDASEEQEVPVPEFVNENYDKIASFSKKSEYHFIFKDEDNRELFGVEIAESQINWYPARQKKSKAKILQKR